MHIFDYDNQNFNFGKKWYLVIFILNYLSLYIIKHKVNIWIEYRLDNILASKKVDMVDECLDCVTMYKSFVWLF